MNPKQENLITVLDAGSTKSCVLVAELQDGVLRYRGHGIEPDQRESIFNPFFTTKASGTGLGLAIVAKIVGEHRGKIDVESKPGEGSTFRVCLPTE